ncbi:MAG: T9SS type A sorting domain-containing protein [Ignavibacteriae bacterium]|nr:T9SS type A sorting domain-containing protein [Ignavibacteriota bacterium]
MKRGNFIVIIILATVGIAFPQSRYLVSPTDEVIPLTKAEQTAASELNKRLTTSVQTPCSNDVIDGYPSTAFPTSSRFGAYHKDVLGQWFVARFNGRIDTLYWYHSGAIGAQDSTIWLRIFRSNISRTQGPGISPYPPPCSPWGYYQNTYTNEVSPFKLSNDYFWVSTVDGDSLSFSPFGEELWKQGGDTVSVHEGLNQIALTSETDSLVVSRGDVFFVTMQVNGTDSQAVEGRTEWAAAGFSSFPPEYQEYYPSRNWKYYAGRYGPSNCAGHPVDSLPFGWLARGGFTDDTLDVSVYNWWYSTSVTDNTPPRSLSSELLEQLFCDQDSFCISFELEDCNPANPVEAGIENVHIEWMLDGAPMWDIPATKGIVSSWSVCIPRLYSCGTISWTIVATDSQGLTSRFPQNSIKFCSMNNQYATVDTSSNCPTLNISGTGNFIPPESFFDHPNNVTPNESNDGTAGPFPLGGTFNFYGKELRYAWVGVNGAIALSETATETLDVNSAGFFSEFDFPGSIRSHSDPRDTMRLGRKPPNFIAPFWNDLLYKDSVSRYGSILWDTSGCNFIVQWDSLATFDALANPIQDEFVFRVVMNRCNRTIEFQYDNVGVAGLDSTALIGFQADTIPALGNRSPWSFINRRAAPCSPIPHNGSCFKIRQPNSLDVSSLGNQRPLEFAMIQNYPNPFNPTTNFGLRIANFELVTLKVYDVLGREVATILNEKKEPGEYTIEWDASNVPSGIYFYKMTAGKFSDVKKLLLIK